jgi:alpha-1,2-rhamnosyltransferase
LVTETLQPNATRIYFDVSETLGHDVRTGIQRVVREIARKSAAMDGKFAIIPVVAMGGELYRLSPQGEKQLRSPDPVTYAPAAPYRTPLPVRIVRAVLSLFPPIVEKVRRRRAAKLFDKRVQPFAAGKPLRLGAGDRLVLADTYGHSTVVRAAIKARKRGAAFITLTHDLFPITHKHLVDDESSVQFARNVPPAMAASDGVLTISDWCVGELRKFGVTKPIGRVYWGYDLPTSESRASSAGAPAAPNWPAGLWDGEAPVIVMVGSIATSKGHPVALEAFERLWAEGVDCRLLMIGQPSWEVDTLIRRIKEHGEFNQRLFMIHGASDDMVDEAYRRAFAGIIGSQVEGFGLPLVEALARSLPVIASDIEIFREIAGDAVLRYEQSNPDALAAAVRTMLAERDIYAQKARDFSWITWDASRDAFAFEADRLAKQAGK